MIEDSLGVKSESREQKKIEAKTRDMKGKQRFNPQTPVDHFLPPGPQVGRRGRSPLNKENSPSPSKAVRKKFAHQKP